MTDHYAEAERIARGTEPWRMKPEASAAATTHAVLAAVDELRALRPNLGRLAAGLDAWAAHTGAPPTPAAQPRDDEEPMVPADPLHVLISEWQNTTCSDRSVNWALHDCAHRLQRVIEEAGQ